MEGSSEAASSNGSEKKSFEPQNVLEGCDLFNSRDPLSFDWQSTKCKLRERFEYILNKQLFYDVHFIVGSEAEKIAALKVVLMAGSSVFLTMFSEKWSPDCNEVEVPDVKPAAFKEFLRFLYSDKVNLTSEMVFEMSYIAKKYAVRALEIKCADFLLSKLCAENAFTILIQARLFDEEALTDACLEVIDNNTPDTLKTDDFCNIDAETLCLLLKRPDLAINEIDLFKAVFRWSEAACERGNLPINPQNQRSVLKNALSLLRFPSMSADEFESEVIDSGLLSEAEIISVLRYFIRKSSPCIGFSSTLRGNYHAASRYQNECSGSFQSDWCHSIIFSSDRNIQVVGIGLYGSPNKPAEYTVNVTLETHDNNRVLSEVSGVYDGSKRIYKVMLKQPVSLIAKVKYRFGVTIKGNFTLCGSDAKQSVTVHLSSDKKAIISFAEGTFTKSEILGITETYASNGQIPEIFFRI